MSVATEAVNGEVRLAYEVRGTGPPLLLVHGLGYARWGWEPVADALAERFTTILFDNRGVGESDVPPGPYTARMMAEDAIAILDDAGLDRIHVLGTSLGGMVAQELVLGWPERVDRLVLACTTPGGPAAHPMPRQTVLLLGRVMLMSRNKGLRLLVENALAPGAGRPELVERILAHRLSSPFDPAGWQAQAAAGVAFDALERLDAISAPTLVLQGTADVVVDPRNAELLARRIAGARLEFFPEGGHLFFWEDPQRFVQVVGEFLSEAS
ncbi:MAG: alpha/beta fold hydrolase [Actinobacteria bacterium]|nr:alpha/beta fold hydrolase [Actinomycetota bacterium]